MVLYEVQMHGLEINKNVMAEIRLSIKDSLSLIVIESGEFYLELIVPDLVEIDELKSFFSGQKKKSIALCHLKRQEKTYRGKRKLLWKDEKVMMSQGGIRLEFDKDGATKILAVLELIKDAYSKG